MNQDLHTTFQNATSLSEDNHLLLRFETGCEWVEYRFQFKPVLRKKWLASPVFWKWWEIQWDLVLRQFLKSSSDDPLYMKFLCFTNKSFPANPIATEIYKPNINEAKR